MDFNINYILKYCFSVKFSEFDKYTEVRYENALVLRIYIRISRNEGHDICDLLPNISVKTKVKTKKDKISGNVNNGWI